MAKQFIRTNKAIWDEKDKSQYKDSIVFIEDVKQIWSNGIYYNADNDSIEDMQSQIDDLYLYIEEIKAGGHNMLGRVSFEDSTINGSITDEKLYGENVYLIEQEPYMQSPFITYEFNEQLKGGVPYVLSFYSKSEEIGGFMKVLVASLDDEPLSIQNIELSVDQWGQSYGEIYIDDDIDGFKLRLAFVEASNIYISCLKLQVGNIPTAGFEATSVDIDNLQKQIDSGRTVADNAQQSANAAKNTTGATSITSKLYLIGATEQTANPQTYTYNNVYIDNEGYLCQRGSNTNIILNQMFRVLPFNITNDRFTPAGKASQSVYRPLQWNQAEGFTHHAIKYTSVYNPNKTQPEVIPISGPITIIELRKHNPESLILRLLGEPVGAINNGQVSTTNVLNTTSSSNIFSPRKVIIFVDAYSSERLNSINYQCLNNLNVNVVCYTQYDYSHGIPYTEGSQNGSPYLNKTMGSYVLELDLFLDTSVTPNKWNILGTQKFTVL